MTPRPFLPGQLVVRLAGGLELPHIRTHRDVRSAGALPSTALDRGGPVDQTLRRFSAASLITRAFGARSRLATPGAGHLGYDALEHALGLSRTFRIRVDPAVSLRALADALGSLEKVEMASPQWLAQTPHRPGQAMGEELPPDFAPEDHAARRVGAPRALEMEPGDSALVLGLVDSGVRRAHAELAGRLRPGLSSVALMAEDMPGGLSVLEGARPGLQDVEDDEGHGTFCAGLLVANGFRVGRGVGGAARLLPVRALCGARLGPTGHLTAVGSLSDIDSGMKTAVDLGARVLNLSFGTPESQLGPADPLPHAEVVRYALERGCVLVVACGNSGVAERFYPAALPGVIAVGSVDAEGRPSAFTTRGGHVALCAPGEKLASAGLHGYTRASGTSFAAPYVAGAAALLLSRASRRSTPLPPDAVRRALVDSATPFAQGLETEGCGAGVLQIPRALAAVDALLALPSREAVA